MGSLKPIGLDASYRGFGVSCGKETIVISTEPNDDQTTSQNCQRRSQEIISRIIAFIFEHYDPDDEILAVLEGPSYGSNGHLFEAGWLYSELYNRLPFMINRKMTVAEIPPTTFKKWLTGKGRSVKGESKADVAKAIKERWGQEFELDRGGNKADAFGLYKMGIAILEGEYEFHRTARRGKGKGKKRVSKTKHSDDKRTKHSQEPSQDKPDKPARRGRRSTKTA